MSSGDAKEGAKGDKDTAKEPKEPKPPKPPKLAPLLGEEGVPTGLLQRSAAARVAASISPR